MNRTKGFTDEQKFAMHWGLARKLDGLLCYLEETPEINREELIQLVYNELQKAIAVRDKLERKRFEKAIRENRMRSRFG